MLLTFDPEWEGLVEFNIEQLLVTGNYLRLELLKQYWYIVRKPPDAGRGLKKR